MQNKNKCPECGTLVSDELKNKHNCNYVCQDCGEEKPDISMRLCPYADEINDSQVYVQICDDCEHERAMDI